MLDRIDIQVEMPEISFAELSDNVPSESSASVRAKVEAAREISRARFKAAGDTGYASRSNALMQTDELRAFCELDEACTKIMENVYNKINLSARGYDRILRVARTIADIEFAQSHTSPTEENGVVGGRLKKHHLTEAIQMRVLDRKYDL